MKTLVGLCENLLPALKRVEFQVESIDRMLLNLYVPHIQHPNGVLQFLLGQRKNRLASTALLG